MHIFIDESWQSTKDGKYKVGVLAAIAVQSNSFNDLSLQLYKLKCKHFGPKSGNRELKGKGVFKKFAFKLEKNGPPSINLNYARDIFKLMQDNAVQIFGAVTYDEGELRLSCANHAQLDRPFFFLFERINLYMQENFPTLTASIIFDDRESGVNKQISKAVSNFLSKSYIGRNFDKLLKVPFFGISSENVGIQMADIVAHVIARRFAGDKGPIVEFFKKVKLIEFLSKSKIKSEKDGISRHLRGIKVAGSKEMKLAS